MSEADSATVTCTACGAEVEYPLDLAGTTCACPACAVALELPASDLGSAVLTVEDLPRVFTGTIARRRTPWLYQVGLLLVSVMMLLLPIVYLAIIGLVLWGTCFYAKHCYGILQSFSGGGRVYLVKLMAYLTPIFAGVALVFFMLKPLVARRKVGALATLLLPQDQPLLWAFVEQICRVVGAPRPVRIELDCQLNASARFRRGFLSFLGSDLVLTLGLPLVAGLNTAELAGVIAHEFGHSIRVSRCA